jgi:hypothetical protein
MVASNPQPTGFEALRLQIKARKPQYGPVNPAPKGMKCRECGSENIETQDENDVRWVQCIHCGAFYSESIPGKEY